MDKTDAVAVVGKTKQQATDYIKKNISGEFGKVLEEDNFPSSNNNPEKSENPGKKGGAIVAVGYDAIKDFYKWDTGATEEEEAAFTVAHGTGHNATENHDSGIMSGANKLLWNKPKLKDLSKKGVSNEDYTNSMKKRFGNKAAIDNYNKNKKAKSSK